MAFPYKCALVTGATSGIGGALARKLIEHGTFVIATGRRQERLQELLEELGPAKVGVEQFDVSDLDKLEGWVMHLVEKYPEIDAVILNAGTQYHPVLLDPKSVSLDRISAEAQTNYLSPVHLSLLFLPHLQALSQKRPTALCFVTSGLAIVPNLMSPTYSATKAAVHSFTWTLRATLAADYPSLRVLEIIPPAVQTELHSTQGKAPLGIPLKDFTEETWEALMSGKDEMPIGTAKAWSATVDSLRREVFEAQCIRLPATRPEK